jgi:hypothetical protein
MFLLELKLRKLTFTDARFEVFMTKKIEFMVFWVVASCNVMVGYQHFGGLCCLHLWGSNPSSMVLQNIGIQPSHYMVQQHRKPQILS